MLHNLLHFKSAWWVIFVDRFFVVNKVHYAELTAKHITKLTCRFFTINRKKNLLGQFDLKKWKKELIYRKYNERRQKEFH